jgi:hypothetical protein
LNATPSKKDFKLLIAKISESDESGNIIQKALSVLKLPAAGHKKEGIIEGVGSSIYLRGVGNQAVLINSENPNGHFYEDKNNDDIPVRCIQKSSSIDSNDSTEAPTLTIETNVNGAVRAGKHVTFTFIFKEPVFGFTDEDVKIENGTVKAGLTRDKSKAHAWKLVVRPAQGRNSGVLKVEVRADSVFGKKANGNKAAIGSVSLNTLFLCIHVLPPNLSSILSKVPSLTNNNRCNVHWGLIPFKVIRLRIGNTSQEKYNEIDAVKLIGNTTTPI